MRRFNPLFSTVMRFFSIFVLLCLLYSATVTAQDLTTMKGSVYCAQRKSQMPVTMRPAQVSGLPGHSFDVLKYTLDLNLYGCYTSPYPKSFTASAIVKFRIDSTLNSINLNAVGSSLIIDSVKMAGTGFTHFNNILTIQLDQTYEPGDTAEVKIFYRHKNVTDNAFYSRSGMVFTDCEPEGARKWFPCWDKPADKAQLDLTAKTKANVKLGSNGYLADSLIMGDTCWYHWISNENIATYLMVISSKVNYKLDIVYWHKLSNPSDSIPLRFYYNSGENPGTVRSLLPLMTTWYSEHYIEHPFPKNGFSTLNSDFSWGGMENQTLTSLCPGCWSESLAAHEFAHQWFGDMITCNTWADIWLNEGFATWSEAFWSERSGGYSAYKSGIFGEANSYLNSNPGWPISDPDWAINTPVSDVLFNYAITYAKGACVVHQLRYVLGDSLFFATLQAYCADPAFKFNSATIQEFNQKVNLVTGEDYTWFFDEWIFQANHPIYQNTYNFENLGNGFWRVNFIARQTQTNASFFKMPIEIKVRFQDNTDTLLRVMNDLNEQQFHWIFDKRPVLFQFDPDQEIVLKGGSTIVAVPENSSSPDEGFSLSQNRPNPCTTSTTIRFELPVATHVQLTLFNSFGQMMAKPVNEYRAPGAYESILDLAGLTPGIYYYQLQSETRTATRKLVLTR